MHFSNQNFYSPTINKKDLYLNFIANSFNKSGLENLETIHLHLFYLALLNQYDFIDWQPREIHLSQKTFLNDEVMQGFDFVYKRKNEIQCEDLVLLDEHLNNELENPFKHNKVRLEIDRLQAKQLDQNHDHDNIQLNFHLFYFQNSKLNFKSHKCKPYKESKLITGFYKIPKNFENEEELAQYFTLDVKSFLKEIICNLKFIIITIRLQSHFIDVGEFQNILQYNYGYLSDPPNWKRYFKISEVFYPVYASLDDNYFEDEIEKYIFGFLKTNEQRMQKTCEDIMKNEYGLEIVIKNTANLFKIVLGIKSPDFLEYVDKIKTPSDFVKIYNELSIINSLENEYDELLNVHHGEVNFHLIFLIFLSLNSNIVKWQSDMRCTRLKTFVFMQKISKSKTGFCDVFYTDSEDVSYVLELKYCRRSAEKRFTNVEAIDQARSYQVHNNVKCIGITFCEEECVFRCELSTNGSTFDGDKPYKRVSRVQLFGEFTNESEVALKFNEMSNIEFEKLKDNVDQNEYLSIFLNNEAYLIDMKKFEFVEKELLCNPKEWENTFSEIKRISSN